MPQSLHGPHGTEPRAPWLTLSPLQDGQLNAERCLDVGTLRGRRLKSSKYSHYSNHSWLRVRDNTSSGGAEPRCTFGILSPCFRGIAFWNRIHAFLCRKWSARVGEGRGRASGKPGRARPRETEARSFEPLIPIGISSLKQRSAIRAATGGLEWVLGREGGGAGARGGLGGEKSRGGGGFPRVGSSRLSA